MHVAICKTACKRNGGYICMSMAITMDIRPCALPRCQCIQNTHVNPVYVEVGESHGRFVEKAAFLSLVGELRVAIMNDKQLRQPPVLSLSEHLWATIAAIFDSSDSSAQHASQMAHAPITSGYATLARANDLESFQSQVIVMVRSNLGKVIKSSWFRPRVWINTLPL